jgi:CHAD domain-containing protein
MMISDFFRKQFEQLDSELTAVLPRVHARAPDDEAIHDLRVTIRKVRVLLKLARAPYGRFYANAVRDGFTRLHRSTSLLRDEEVLHETLAKLHVRDRAFRTWQDRRRARERMLRRRVVALLHSGALEESRELLRALVKLPVKPRHDGDLSTFARKETHRAQKRVERLRDTPAADTTGLHALRIAYKGLRYAAEMMQPALPIDLGALAKPAATFQKRLGELHDLDMALGSIGRARGMPHATRARVLCALRRARKVSVDRYLSEMRPAAPAVAVISQSLPPSHMR